MPDARRAIYGRNSPMSSNFSNAGLIAIASFLTASSVVGVASVADAKTMHKSAVAAAADTSDPTANAVRSWRGGPLNVMSTDELPSSEAQSISDQDQLEPSQLTSLRNAVRANPALERALAKQDVSIKDIAGATVSADGGILLYTM
jgi:hypothetical protein